MDYTKYKQENTPYGPSFIPLFPKKHRPVKGQRTIVCRCPQECEYCQLKEQ